MIPGAVEVRPTLPTGPAPRVAWTGRLACLRRRGPALAPKIGVTVVTVALMMAGCSLPGGSGQRATPSARPATTGPPPGASQAPGPPLATASAAPNATTPPAGSDPAAVATYCFARWQTFDARTDASLGAGVQRAAADQCFTPDFLGQLASGTGTGASTPDAGAGPAWEDLRAHGAHSTVTVLAATPLGDTAATGRVVYLLNARSDYASDNATATQTVSTPTVTLLRDTAGRWRIAGADLSASAGDAPGR
ncbi:hypothetical protein [Pseudofrankia sp. DC12]|uniref:hypothetical protein n=1 Tax=Pseudofrankia sp. DC12 TaxID=683315 RepID=UPI0005F7BE14|nr:hypothetical protein [Pseudofrankia sp. DC12]